MKRAVMIALFFVLVVSIGTSFAVEVTLFGPQQYLRTKGKPDVYSDGFSIHGLTGEGKLIIKNGDQDGNHRISSALIHFNGEQIFGPDDFNQQVYNLEASVDLVEDNFISVELRSKPRSYLTIRVTQEITVEIVEGSTDSEGEVRMQSRLLNREVAVKTISEDGTALQGMQVEMFTDGDGVLVMVHDPSGQYYPNFYAGNPDFTLLSSSYLRDAIKTSLFRVSKFFLPEARAAEPTIVILSVALITGGTIIIECTPIAEYLAKATSDAVAALAAFLYSVGTSLGPQTRMFEGTLRQLGTEIIRPRMDQYDLDNAAIVMEYLGKKYAYFATKDMLEEGIDILADDLNIPPSLRCIMEITDYEDATYVFDVVQQCIPDYEWAKTFGGSRVDYGYSVEQTTDGGYIIVGATDSFDGGWYDAYLIKTDAFGNEVWSQTFDRGSWDAGYSVRQTADGGYIIVGETYTPSPIDIDVYLIKTDAFGNEVWSQTFGRGLIDVGRSVEQTPDGGYIVVGSTYSLGSDKLDDVYLIKTDAFGNEVWSQTFGGINTEHGFSVQQADGGYVIVGQTNSFGAGDFDIYLIKTDAFGNMIWGKTFGGSCLDRGRSVQQTPDGNYIIVGATDSFGAGSSDVYLLKIDAFGNEVWSRTFGGSDRDSGFFARQADGGYIIVGETMSYGAGEREVYLIWTDAFGNEVWSQIFGGSEWDSGYCVQQTAEGNYIIVGSTASSGAGDRDVYLIKTSGL